MSVFWSWSRTEVRLPKKVSLPEKRPAHDTRGYAGHLRGRAFRTGRCWAIEVINTATGDRIVFDNGHRDLNDAFMDAEFATAAARQAWMRGFRHKDLKR